MAYVVCNGDYSITFTVKQFRFLTRWTWFDADKAREFIAKGDAEGAGAWARSAAHDVIHAEDLKGLY